MKYLAPLYLVTVIMLATGGDLFAQAAKGKQEVLTNESIISLAKAGFKERTILTIIRTSPINFDVSTLKLVELKKQGVSEKIITEMVERARAGEAARRFTPLSDDDFFSKDDEAFFNGSSVFKELPSEKEARKRQDEAMIFGSKSGSRSQTRVEGSGPGPSSEQQGQSEMVGSATVRIINPAGEGAAVPKLERAPKLDNQSVLEFVQAGFSEGTIIRKIETSQVDFDLSAKALADLRKNRVTDRVIKAMTQAMDESK